jgi:hypothetical protein
LSDLAQGCEYLTGEKQCLTVCESEKAKAGRQLRCRNDDKSACCYLCIFVLGCASPCQFLGNPEGVPQRRELEEKPKVDESNLNHEKANANRSTIAQAALCSSCNAEMTQGQTKFRIDRWEATGENVEKELSAIYLCPKCGKIEFKVDKT